MSSPFVYLSVYARQRQNNDSQLSSSSLLKKISISVVDGFYLMLNLQTNKTKIVTSQCSCDKALNEFAFISKVVVAPTGTFNLQGEISKQSKCISTREQLKNITFMLVDRNLPLNHGDIVQFGRQAFRVQFPWVRETPPWDSRVHIEKKENVEGVCRICLDSDNNVDLISPCSCIGSCAFVHLSCLTEWVTAKRIMKSTTNVRTYNIGEFSCEICKGQIPRYIQKQGEIKQLLPKYAWNEATIFLEQITNNSNKILHCLKIEEDQEISIGRNSFNNLILQYSSVSRFHGRIYRKNNQFYIADNKSKFGTFLSLNNKVQQCKNATLLTNQILYLLQSSQ